MNDDYDIVHTNIGSEALTDVHISYGKFKSACGALPPSASATHCQAGAEAAIPEDARAEWVTVANGEKHEKLLKVKSMLPKGRFRGELIFLFKNDDVRLDWRTSP